MSSSPKQISELITSTTPVVVPPALKKPRKPRVPKVKAVSAEAVSAEAVDVVKSLPVEALEKPEKPEKKKRAPSAYNIFVKEHYSEFKDLPTKERFAPLSKLWAEEKAKLALTPASA